ncbi:choice-of-anchor Q domain-containing protein [Runella sp. SP2]|uniref:choice-of-anchor Q domain-containing protein n=1 Tax=Runella sp. SP2 TaxID=2268026 RepID=UPI000F08719A|nr:choice-of-anchor Q domain-containing protein [Runella sp. SP2]AYQ33520.1 T9SS C-terminal target domain-containing protein [Runella sp. SP2]
MNTRTLPYSLFRLGLVCFWLTVLLFRQTTFAKTHTAPCNSIFYVKANASGANNGSSWADAYTSLQDALAVACSGAQIWVAAGTYKPTADPSGNTSPADPRTKTFVMKNGVAIYGGFPNDGSGTMANRNWNINPTILSGNIGDAGENTDNSYRIIFNNGGGLNNTAILDGFTIQDAYNPNTGSGNEGGGIRNVNGSPLFRNCIIRNNFSNQNGGGVYAYDSSPVFINCVFVRNKASALGGAVFVEGGTYSFVNCIFYENSSTRLDAGGIVSNLSVTTVLLSNSILWGNFWGNQPASLSNQIDYSNVAPQVSHSIVQGGYTGTGNLSADPLFINPANGNFRLQQCSPAINAGDPATTSATVGSLDLGGNARFYNNGRVDLGAYEYQSAPPTAITPTLSSINPTTCGGSEGSITLSGFLNTTVYSVTYKKNNVAVSAANFTSNGSGVITLTGLAAGNYTEIVATYGACVSNAVTATLEDPAKPSLTLGTIPAICADATTFTIPYSNPTDSPSKYSITGTGITTVSDGDLTNPIMVQLSGPASGSSIPFTLTVKNSTTNCVSDIIQGSVTVDPVSVGGSIAGSATVCSGTNSTTLTLSGQVGTIQKWQSSLSSDFSGAVDIANTTTELIASNLTQTTYYRAIVKSGVCSQANSVLATVTVDPVSVGGSIAGSATVCSGTNSTTLTLSGQVGTIQKWQSSLSSDFSGAVDVSNTTTQLIASNLTQTTYYRAVVKSGVCSQTNSVSATVTVDPVSVGGSIAGSATVCSGTNSTTLTLSGQVGTIQKWQSSLSSDFSGAVDIANTTTELIASNLTQTTYYRAVVKSGVCSQANSVSATVTVDPVSVGGSISGSATVCSGTNSTTLTLSGQVGNVQKWQSSLSSDFSGAVDISNTTTELTASNLTQTTYYRAIVKSGVCSQANSVSATVTVDPVSVGGSVSGSATVCSGTNSTTLTLSGQVGNIQKWQSSLSSDFSGAVDISNTTTELIESNLTQTTYYRAVVKSGVCSQANSVSATVTVDPVSVGGSISGSATVCSGTNSTKLTLSGQVGNIQKWQSSLSSDFSGAVDIANTTTELTASNLTQTTYYRAIVKSGVCSQANSVSATVTVDPVSVGGSIAGSATVCSGTNSTKLTLSGQVGNIQKWQSSLSSDFSGATDISNTTTELTASNLTQTTYYRATVKNGTCSQATSTLATVQVQSKPTITLTTLQQTLNEGNSQTFCDTDANPVNGLQFTVSGLCVSGNPVWRVQVGSGSWSNWSPNAPVSQSSNNQVHRYQAACDASCPVTYTNPIELTINYRSTVPQNVSLLVDGVTVAVGETKEVCSLVNMPLTFTTNCGANEVVVYSVDGGEYSAGVPVGLVDNQYHNYRVRCRQSGGIVSCVESESGVMRLKLVVIPSAPTVSLSSTSSCNPSASFSGQSSCGSLRTIWYNATTNVALPSLPSTVPSQTTSYYARCQTENGCVSEKSNVVTFTLTPTQVAPIITVSQEIVCTGTTVRISANCPAGSQTFWNTGVTTSSFEVSFSNVTKQSYWAKCVFSGGCQSAESVRKDVYWNAFVVTLINIGESKSAVKVNDRAAWSSQFITRDGGPELEQSTQVNPTLYYVENANKQAPRYWTINVEACGLSTDGSLTFDMLATPEMGVLRSFNTHENNAPYFMYANREGWTELYAQNHPAYGFYQDNGAGGNVYDAGLPKGLYKLGIRYWDQKGWGSIYPSTRKAQGNVLAYQEYWFRIQSKDGVGVGAAREGANGKWQWARGEGQGVFATVLPNPVTNILRLKVQESKGKVVQTTLTDAAGRDVLNRQFVPETNTHQEEFGVSALPVGMYFLKVATPDQQATLKVVKVE